jgi:hypothetical protein
MHKEGYDGAMHIAYFVVEFFNFNACILYANSILGSCDQDIIDNLVVSP